MSQDNGEIQVQEIIKVSDELMERFNEATSRQNRLNDIANKSAARSEADEETLVRLRDNISQKFGLEVEQIPTFVNEQNPKNKEAILAYIEGVDKNYEAYEKIIGETAV